MLSGDNNSLRCMRGERGEEEERGEEVGAVDGHHQMSPEVGGDGESVEERKKRERKREGEKEKR